MRFRIFAVRQVAAVALLSGLVLIATDALGQNSPAPPTPAKPGPTTLTPTAKPWTGACDGMVKARAIRALVPYSKTFYFVDRAVQRGLSYEVTRLLEADINKQLKTGNVRIHLVCIPVSRGEMISGLLEGKGDIAMGNL